MLIFSGRNLACFAGTYAQTAKRAASPLLATGQDGDNRSLRVEKVPLGDKVVQWVLQMGGNGTDKTPCTPVTFNQPALNCRSGPKVG